MASYSKPKILLSIGRILLGGIFLYAVFAKLNYPPGNFFSFSFANWKLAVEIFAISVNGYQVLPDWAVTPVAYFVIGLESVLGIMLIAGLGLRWAGAASAGLLGFFFSLMLRASLLGQSIDCGCFGPGDQLGPKTLIRMAQWCCWPCWSLGGHSGSTARDVRKCKR